MKASSHRWVGLSAAALLLALGGGVALAIRSPEPPPVSLADGSTASVVAVTDRGKAPVLGSPLQRLLHQMLPPGLRQWSGARVVPGPGSGRINVWVRKSSVQPRYSATLVDELGDESEGSLEVHIDDLSLFSFDAYPRRWTLAGLRLYSPKGHTVGDWGEYATGWKNLGELPLSIPAQESATNWDAPALPATGRVGNLQLSVTRLTVGEKDHPDIPRKAGETCASVAVRLTQGGRPAPGWYTDLEHISDATGNRWRAFGRKFEDRPDGGSRIIFTTPARPGEGVWNLHFVLRRATAAPPLPEEVWKLSGVPLPSPGKVLSLGRKTQLQGIPVELAGVYGAGTSIPSSIGGERVTGGGGFLMLIGGPSSEVDTQVRSLRDQRGRDIDRMSSVEFGGQELHLLEPSPSSRTFDFTYVVRRSRYLEVRAPRTLLKP